MTEKNYSGNALKTNLSLESAADCPRLKFGDGDLKKKLKLILRSFRVRKSENREAEDIKVQSESL